MTISSLFRLLGNPIGPAFEAFFSQALCMLRSDHLLLWAGDRRKVKIRLIMHGPGFEVQHYLLP